MLIEIVFTKCKLNAMEYQDMLHGELLSIIIGIGDKGTIYFNETKLLFVQPLLQKNAFKISQ